MGGEFEFSDNVEIVVFVLQVLYQFWVVFVVDVQVVVGGGDQLYCDQVVVVQFEMLSCLIYFVV